MEDTLFTHLEFAAFVVGLTAIPVLAFGSLYMRNVVTHVATIVVGLILVVVAACDFYLLGMMRDIALRTPSRVDDRIFTGAPSVALYFVVLYYAVTGVALVRRGVKTFVALRADRARVVIG